MSRKQCTGTAVQQPVTPELFAFPPDEKTVRSGLHAHRPQQEGGQVGMIRFQVGLGLWTPPRRLQTRDRSRRLTGARGLAAVTCLAAVRSATAALATPPVAAAAFATLALARTL